MTGWSLAGSMRVEAPPGIRASDEARFWAKVDRTGDCWLWTAAVMNNGYGRFKQDGKTRAAHRVAYEMLAGPLLMGQQLDHLCRVRACVNPAHLEPVTPKVNVLRGRTITARNAAKMVCDRGHQLAGENLFVRRDGRRRCRTCNRATERRARATDSYRQKHAADERRRRAEKKEQ